MPTELLPVDYGSAGDGTKKIATLTLVQPGRPVVVIEQSLLEQLDATLDTLPDDLDGFILASAAERAFVAGADLKAIMALDDAELHTYLEFGARVFQRIADFPFPTAAAIHSTTLGGGLELAMHCDGLIGLNDASAKPYLIGLPEAGLKICPGWGGTNLLPARIDAETAIVATANGTAFKSDIATKLGIFDQTCDSREELIHTAMIWLIGQEKSGRSGHPARCIQMMNPDEIETALDKAKDDLVSAYHTDAVLDAVQAGLSSGWTAALKCERDHLVRLRNTEPAKEAIEAFFSKSKK
ncbi:MAG: enoyl-CoA hydratase/isomerase family protein [Phycisphaerales bacterium]|nr:enoyl-CoA hydratase/isomerase family protein [Phycisphaerales bacterium]